MTSLYAELSDDESRIILLSTGPAEDLVYLAKRLQTLTPLIKKSDPPGALVLPASWPAAVQLAATFGREGAWQPSPRFTEWAARQAAARTAGHPDTLTAPAPAGLTPRPYQVAGAHLIASTGIALISDEPGTGKSVTTVLGLRERAVTTWEGVGPIVVVCPASVVDPWVEHFTAWAPEWLAVAWRGTPKQRRALAAHGRFDVYVTSYETCRTDVSGRYKELDLARMKPVSVVIDEHHLIKNHQAARTTAVKRLAKHARNVIALSGTPITHHPADLWATLTCLWPTAWPSRERWVSRYCMSIPDEYGETILGLNPGTEQEFRLALLGAHRRVAKADVLDQLPPKVYSVRTVEMPEEWRTAYDAFERDMLAALPSGEELTTMSVLSQIGHLFQLAAAAADVEVTEGPDVNEVTGELKVHYSLTLKAPSWKVDALLEILDERPGEQVVVFAPSRQLIVLAGQACEKAGYRVGYIVGEQSQKERTTARERFQAGELDVICVTTGAGGVGITLTAARTAVFLQRPWSIVDSIQAEDRLHRIGAEKHDSIDIIDIITKNSIDSRVRAALKEKAGQLSDLVQDKRIVAELLGGSNVTKL